MSSLPLSIQIGPAAITYFSLIWITAIATTGTFAAFRAKNTRGHIEIVIDTLLWMSLSSLLVARIFYVFNPAPSSAVLYDRQWYLTHPLDLQVGIMAVWSGGLGAAGALLGGLSAGFWHLRRRGVDVWKWADIFAPALLLGLAIAPWANIVNQQLYGPPTRLPWGMFIEKTGSLYPSGTLFHPTPAYVSLWTLTCLAMSLLLEQRVREISGSLFLVCLASYLAGMFLAEWIRLDVNHGLFGLTGMQWFAFGIIALCMLQLHRRRTLHRTNFAAGGV